MCATVHTDDAAGKERTNNSNSPSCAFDVVAITASAGGIEALCSLLAVLPKHFPAAVLVVQHLPSRGRFESKLDTVLQRATALHVKWAEEGDCIRPGVVFLAPQDQHMSVDSEKALRLTAGPKIHRTRPAADPLFSSVAAHFGARAIAVVLSGILWDGAEGAWNVARQGGRVLVQDDSAIFFDMPLATLQAAGVDFMYSPTILAHVLITLVSVPGAADWFRVWRSIPAQFVRSKLYNSPLVLPD